MLMRNNGKACKQTRVCPETACDLSCGCEWLRVRQTESIHVAISCGKKVQNRMAEVGESVNALCFGPCVKYA